MKITIELDVFSGRPNPTWVLEKDEADKISKMLENLAPCKTPVPADGLGYRGFILTIEKEGKKKETTHVYANMVWVNDGNEKKLTDQNHAEQMLLQMAKEKGYGSILDMFGL